MTAVVTTAVSPVREQLPYLCRAVRWQPILGAGVAAATAALADLSPVLVVAVVASGASYLLDDPAAVLLDATPAGRPHRRALRLGLALPVAAVVWLAVVQPLWALRPGAPAAGAAHLALAALVAVVLAGSAFGGGIAGAPLAVGVAVAGAVLPAPWNLVVAPGQSRNWIIILALAAAVLVVLSRDPAARWGDRR